MTNTEHLHLNLPGKTDATTPATLSGNFQAIDAAVADKAAATAVDRLRTLAEAAGNCCITWGEYTGDGTWGADHPTRFEVDFYPVLLVIAPEASTDGFNYVHLRPLPNVRHDYTGNFVGQVIWGDRSISIVSPSRSTTQFNGEDLRYCYAILGLKQAGPSE